MDNVSRVNGQAHLVKYHCGTAVYLICNSGDIAWHRPPMCDAIALRGSGTAAGNVRNSRLVEGIGRDALALWGRGTAYFTAPLTQPPSFPETFPYLRLMFDRFLRLLPFLFFFGHGARRLGATAAVTPTEAAGLAPFDISLEVTGNPRGLQVRQRAVTGTPSAARFQLVRVGKAGVPSGVGVHRSTGGAT